MSIVKKALEMSEFKEMKNVYFDNSATTLDLFLSL